VGRGCGDGGGGHGGESLRRAAVCAWLCVCDRRPLGGSYSTSGLICNGRSGTQKNQKKHQFLNSQFIISKVILFCTEKC
jgi:hypothetical protein